MAAPMASFAMSRSMSRLLAPGRYAFPFIQVTQVRQAAQRIKVKQPHVAQDKSRWEKKMEAKQKQERLEKKQESEKIKIGSVTNDHENASAYESEIFERQIPLDPVWCTHHYPSERSTHSLEKSLEMHREMADPSMMDNMNKFVYLELKLDMEIEKEVTIKGGGKETKLSYIPHVNGFMKFPYIFDTKEKKRILVFCKPEEVELALSLGAEFAGGTDLADQIDKKIIAYKSMDSILCTVDALPDIHTIRKKIKSRIPNMRDGTLSKDIVEMITKHRDWITFKSEPVMTNISILTVKVATLDMPDMEIMANIDALIKSVMQQRSNLAPITKPFIYRAVTKTEPGESISINIDQFLPKKKEKRKKNEQKEESSAQTFHENTDQAVNTEAREHGQLNSQEFEQNSTAANV